MNVNNFMNSMFGPVPAGRCRLSMDGRIAIKCADNQYRTYDLSSGNLTNCDNFVFDIGQDFFFKVPTNNVKPGDIILVNDQPRCVIDVERTAFKVVNYSDSTIETLLPERHVFLGKTYFYTKIISLFGDGDFLKGKGTNEIMKYMMLSSVFSGNGNGSSSNNNMNSMLPMLLMMNNGGMDNLFGGIFENMTTDDKTNTKETK